MSGQAPEKEEISLKDLSLHWFKIYPFLSFSIDATLIEEHQQKGNDKGVRKYIAIKIKEIIAKLKIKLTAEEVDACVDFYLRDVNGFGPIQGLMEDEAVTDILINGYKTIYAEQNGRVIPTGVRFSNQHHVNDFLLRMLAQSAMHMDASRSYVDFHLKDGSRVNAITAPLVKEGPVISIRKFSYQRFSLDDLVAKGSLLKEAAEFLKVVAQARLNVIISGGVGTGKTTMMNALLKEVNPAERIITIEDTYELQLDEMHAVRMLSKGPNLDGGGEVSQRDLLKNALRMRPDRIIIGEIRGTEILEMLQAMNTGMDGSIATVHASSVAELPARLANILTIAEVNMSVEALGIQLANTLDIVIQIKKHPEYGRYISEISEVSGLDKGKLLFNEIYRCVIADDALEKRYFPQNVGQKTLQKARDYGVSTDHITQVSDE